MSEKIHISLEIAKGIVIDALDNFDVNLGLRASEILNDVKRLNLIEVDEPKTEMMQCRPSNLTISELEDNNMVIEGFNEKYGPNFSRQDNPENFAIIDFEYDGSYKSVIYLAHELGHAIADDIQKENGNSHKDYSPDEMEEQAYFVQHIVTDFLKEMIPDAHLRGADLGDNTQKMSADRAGAFNHAANMRDVVIETKDEARSNLAKLVLDPKSLV